MEYIAAYFIARSADQQRMSAGRLDGPVEVARPSLWHRVGRALAGTRTTRRAASAHRAPSARTASGKTAPAGGCATA